jgi:xanthine dehydrogenase iron-sulfur cluster and FAD-binding subunit A
MSGQTASAPLSGILCRCTSYLSIEAVLEARAAYRKADKS